MKNLKVFIFLLSASTLFYAPVILNMNYDPYSTEEVGDPKEVTKQIQKLVGKKLLKEEEELQKQIQELKEEVARLKEAELLKEEELQKQIQELKEEVARLKEAELLKEKEAEAETPKELQEQQEQQELEFSLLTKLTLFVWACGPSIVESIPKKVPFLKDLIRVFNRYLGNDKTNLRWLVALISGLSLFSNNISPYLPKNDLEEKWWLKCVSSSNKFLQKYNKDLQPYKISLVLNWFFETGKLPIIGKYLKGHNAQSTVARSVTISASLSVYHNLKKYYNLGYR